MSNIQTGIELSEPEFSVAYAEENENEREEEEEEEHESEEDGGRSMRTRAKRRSAEIDDLAARHSDVFRPISDLASLLASSQPG